MLYNFLSLTLLIFSPLIAAIVIMSPMFGTNPIYIRRFSKTFATIHFLYSLFFVIFYNYSAGSYYREVTLFGQSWIDKLGISAAFTVDGLSVLLVSLTSFVFLIALIFSKTIIRVKQKLYYTLMFFLQTAILGTFCSQDMFVFLLFWEAELIPLYFLISEWSGEGAKRSATKYVVTSFLATSLILCAMIGLDYYGFNYNGVLSSSIMFLKVSEADAILPLFIVKFLFLLFFVGFSMKLPVFPFHTITSDVLVEAPAPISIIISTLSLNIAAYGILRFNVALFPEVFMEYSAIVMLLAIITMLWCSLSAYVQKDIKRIVSYLCISSMGLFLFGIASMNKIGIDGAFLSLIARTFVITGLYIVVCLIYQATKTKSLQEIKGIGFAMPRLKFFAYIMMFAAANIPFTIGFSSVLLIFIGTFMTDVENQVFPKVVTLIALLVLIFTVAALFKMFHGVFCGTCENNKKYNDITGHRLVLVCIITVCIFLFGFCSNYLLDMFCDFSDILLTLLRG